LEQSVRIGNWEYDTEEESDDPLAIGPNGMTVSDYRGTWIRAGKPKDYLVGVGKNRSNQ
jgi:hypothetical protein